MEKGAVRAVTSNQEGIYKSLEQVVRKYAATCFLRPVADHTRKAFEQAKQFVQEYYSTKMADQVCDKERIGSEQDRKVNISTSSATLNVILDSGCGTGESTLHLAKRFPGIPVIGIDKSAMRLNKAGNIHQLENVSTTKTLGQIENGESLIPAKEPKSYDNILWVRAELLDFWKLALEEVESGRWNIVHHAIYYPNPWPKESEATRRFHLHPIFPTLIVLGNNIELRTNWEIYAKEFAAATRIVLDIPTKKADQVRHNKALVTCEAFNPIQPETAFERKYKEAHQQLWRVLVTK